VFVFLVLSLNLIQLSSELGVEDAKQFLRETSFPSTRP